MPIYEFNRNFSIPDEQKDELKGMDYTLFPDDADMKVNLADKEEQVKAKLLAGAPDEQKEYAEPYILETLARRMLEADPELREAFETRIRTDRAFASDPHARLYFFYKRSPYWDDRMNVYPVARIVKPLNANTEPP